MDLDDLYETAVTVWVARVNAPGGDTIVTAWSMQAKAEKWVAHELDVDPDAITWREDNNGGTEPGIVSAGHLNGDIAAVLTQTEIMDPVELSRLYPTDMPAARHVVDNE